MEQLLLPEGFIEEVRMAEQNKAIGKLLLLAYEADSFSWRIPALDLINKTLQKIKTIEPAQTLHYILFTGHMIDKADRKTPRFPPSKEVAVREAIKEKLTEIGANTNAGHSLTGIAGGACGGDILFQEVCEDMGIPAQMYLALPKEKFLAESVVFAGNAWVDRFNQLFDKLPHPVLSGNIDLPEWLEKKPGYNIWVRNNLWMLYGALVNGGSNMTLLALWDGKGGDGPGGTEHMIKVAKEKGATCIIIDMLKI